TQARAAYQEKKYAEAVRAYDEALKAKPNDRLATAERGQAAYQMWLQSGNAALAGKKFGEARMASEEALRIKPGTPEAVKAVMAFEEAVKLRPREMDAVQAKKEGADELDKAMPKAPAVNGKK